MRLAELVARRDVVDAVGEAEVLEPRRLGDVEVVDRMQIVVEAWRRHFLRTEPAAVLQAAIHHQDVEAALLQVRAEHQPVVAGADDDAVVAALQRRRHERFPTYCAASLVSSPSVRSASGCGMAMTL